MKRALFVSPHLDDVAFSCGGTAAALAAAGWHVTLLTCFTATVERPAGFALRCQTDKGIPPSVDYMALRRREDHRAAAALGVHEVVHLPLPEAPHRGYDSAAALFAGVHDDDTIHEALGVALAALPAPDAAFVCQALGDHVDHHQVVRAVATQDWPEVWRYADLPYALRRPRVPGGPGPAAPNMPAKLDACAAYASQLGFQFGGEARMRRALGAAPERFTR